MILVAIIMLLCIVLLAWAWVQGIDNMTKNHSNYEGEDFLDWGKHNPSKKDDEWDNNYHNEDV